ncbi:MAG: hypothetical protein HY954_02305 [Deltaproteobacteria bacterium]|nr:hypothetical protein [Deltaproteobacteria bacterium]
MDLKSCKRIFGKGLQLGLASLLIAGFASISASAAEQAASTPAPAVAAPAADAAAAPADAVAAPAEKGDARIGSLLFTGGKRFTNGAPPCISCHSASVGALGGGVLGPNLTKVYADESKNPLINSAWINNPSTPVMGAVFSNRNVTDEEVDNLRAFFAEQAKGNVAPSSTGTFTIVGLGGFIGILIIFNIIWSGRYRNRNRGTAHDALWRNYGGKGGR